MNIESNIRFIARTLYYQELYKSSKECSGINLFENITNFSGLQILLLYWIKVYDMLYTELANKQWDNLDNDVIKDDDRTSAFLYWRKKEIEKENRENNKPLKKSPKKGMKSFNIYKGGK